MLLVFIIFILMWFLSVYRLKSIISIGIVITLLIGIGLLYILVYSFIISSITAQIQTDFRNIFIAVFLTTSILIIFSSLSGIYGKHASNLGLLRKKNKYVVIYAVTMFVYFVSFIIFVVFIIKYPTYLAE